MENIEHALERAKAQDSRPQRAQPLVRPHDRPPQSDSAASGETIALDDKLLQSNRVISHVITDPRSRSFDMLRTQILHFMDTKDFRVLAVTSPTPNCGKTVTAVNLAISIARQPERSVLLADLDFLKPNVTNVLGLRLANEGALAVLRGEISLPQAVISARISAQSFAVLPTVSTIGNSELMASRQMAAMMQDLRQKYPSRIIIVDLPPILTGDDVISLLPRLDCLLLVTAVGVSTVAQIEECSRHLQTTEVVKVVLNKANEPGKAPPYYY